MQKIKINNPFLRAFTLIELLIAGLLAALLGLAVVSTFSAGFKAYSTLRNDNLAEADVRLSFGKIEKDLRGMFHFTGINFTGDNRSISFPGFMHQSSTIGRVSYFFAPPSRSLIKTEQPYSYALFNKTTDGLDAHVIAPMKDLSFSYYYFDPNTNQYSWHGSFNITNGVPLQVMVRAVFQEGNEDFERQKTMSIPISG